MYGDRVNAGSRGICTDTKSIRIGVYVHGVGDGKALSTSDITFYYIDWIR